MSRGGVYVFIVKLNATTCFKFPNGITEEAFLNKKGITYAYVGL